MIIDLHTRVWAGVDQLGAELAARRRSLAAGDGTRLDASPAAHERNMGCVDGAVVMGFRADRVGARIPNEFIAEFTAKDPRRRVGVAGIDPMSPDVFDELEAAVSLGLAGITVCPAVQGYHPAHSDAMRVYERCAELLLAVFVTLEEPLTAGAILDFARPAAWDEVARSLPSLPIVIGQLGHPWTNEALMLAGKHERVYTDISGVASRPWQLYNALLSASGMGVMDKVLFGSGFPNDTPARVIESVYTVNAYSHGTHLPSIARTSLKAIIEKDSLACLGINAEIAAPRRGEPDDDTDQGPTVEVIQRTDHRASAGRAASQRPTDSRDPEGDR